MGGSASLAALVEHHAIANRWLPPTLGCAAGGLHNIMRLVGRVSGVGEPSAMGRGEACSRPPGGSARPEARPALPGHSSAHAAMWIRYPFHATGPDRRSGR